MGGARTPVRGAGGMLVTGRGMAGFFSSSAISSLGHSGGESERLGFFLLYKGGGERRGSSLSEPGRRNQLRLWPARRRK